MATGWKGVALGALALAGLDVAIGGSSAADQATRAGRVGGLVNLASGAARRFLDPSEPAIPARYTAAAASSSDATPAPVTPAASGTPQQPASPQPASPQPASPYPPTLPNTFPTISGQQGVLA